MIKTWNEYNLYFVIRPDFDICPQILAIADTKEEAIAHAEKLDKEDGRENFFCVIDADGTFYKKPDEIL